MLFNSAGNAINYEQVIIKKSDNIYTYKTVVNTVSSKSGLSASFDPKPIPDCNGS